MPSKTQVKWTWGYSHNDGEKREVLGSFRNIENILAELLENVPGKACLIAYHKCWSVAYDAVPNFYVQSEAEPQPSISWNNPFEFVPSQFGMALCNDGEDFGMEAAEIEA